MIKKYNIHPEVYRDILTEFVKLKERCVEPTFNGNQYWNIAATIVQAQCDADTKLFKVKYGLVNL